VLVNKRNKFFLEKLKFVENYQRFLSKIEENRRKSILFNKLTLCWYG